MGFAKCVLVFYLITIAVGQDLASYFQNCKKGTPQFDNCLRNALNDVRPLFKKGVPQYGIEPFDPFYAELLTLKRGSPRMNFVLTLTRITETGWSKSKVTHLHTDFNNNKLVYSQSFPHKVLVGDYKIMGSIFGNKVNNSGSWNLTLIDYEQTTTITRIPRKVGDGALIYDTPLHVDIKYNNARDMKLFITNLLPGQPQMDVLINNVISGSWRLGMVFLAPLVDELVSNAFTDIFNRNFQNFPFDDIIQ